MQIIIPMSGEGLRFKAAGYQTLKSLICVNGKPIIEYVVDLFPGDHEFLFICREDHAAKYNLTSYLPSLRNNVTLVTIEPHKLGPVYAVLQAKSYIRHETQVLLSYCDYYMDWDFNAFIEQVTHNKEDGSVICYTGFHPHLLHAKNVYAGCRVGANNDLLEIREKYSFEQDKMKGHHSVGAYYFKSGQLMEEYFICAMKKNITLNSEFYVSMVYNLLLQDGLKINVYDGVQHFCQWGTPEDLEEFLYWSDIFVKHKYK